MNSKGGKDVVLNIQWQWGNVKKYLWIVLVATRCGVASSIAGITGKLI